MPIDEITGIHQALPTVQPSRVRPAALEASTPVPTVPTPPPAAVPPAQQIAELINETLQDLNFVPPSPANELLGNELNATATTLIDRQNLTPAQQAALAVNETLQALNFVPATPSEALLINETNPALTAFLEAQTLTPGQQAAAAVNETLQVLTTPPLPTTPAAAAAGNAAPSPTPAPLAAPVAAEVTTAVVAPGVVAQDLDLAILTAAPPQAIVPATTTTVTSEAPIPTPPITPQPVLDRNPIAVPVYEIRDPKAAPAEPKARRREVMPPLPIGRVRPVDRLVLRREWERRREEGQGGTSEVQPIQAERSIQQMVSQANADLAANGLPLRLVLAKNKGGYSIDVYDCSDDTICRLSQEVPIDLNKLLTTLDNLQHETGIMVNIKT